jgi:uncharacterized protein YkwD
MRLAPAACLAAGLLAGLALASAAAGSSGELAAPGRCTASTPRTALLCYVNFARAANGQGKLRQATRLGRAATVKGSAIVRCNDFSHGPCSTDPVAPVRAAGYPFRLWGENLYWGSGPLSSARNAVRGWLRSPGHRQAMLDGRFREIGIAAVRWPGRGTVWVIELGTR